ncbi:MAG TPA: phosphoglycerate dehydrogenase, partial [Deinococcales bacterium]|nr:phosphoglycerate dehydrogenase [Deinococcales bacterium]
MRRILVTDTMQLGDREYEGVEVDYREGIGREELLEIVGDYDALITRSRTQVDAELIDRATRLQVLGRGGVGIDNIDLEAASRRGVLVLNAPAANNVSAAELAVALLLAAARGVTRSDRLIREGIWDRKYLGREVKDATLAVIGIGRIGSLVARRAQGLGMTVIAYDPYVSRQRVRDLGVELIDDLDDLLPRADFLTVHTPLTDETRGLIGARELDLLPRRAVVVNAARGGIIDEAALEEALENDRIFGAGLDVFTLEPPSADHPLLSREDVVLTAHLGANTAEAQARVGEEILERTVLALRGDYSRGVVNAPALSAEVMQKLGTHLELGEALGRMAVQLNGGRADSLEVEFSGSFPLDPDPVGTAVLKGFLQPILSEPPNYVSAPLIARDRGIRVSRVDAAGNDSGYTNHVLVTARSAGSSASVGGTVLGDSPRVVAI